MDRHSFWGCCGDCDSRREKDVERLTAKARIGNEQNKERRKLDCESRGVPFVEYLEKKI